MQFNAAETHKKECENDLEVIKHFPLFDIMTDENFSSFKEHSFLNAIEVVKAKH